MSYPCDVICHWRDIVRPPHVTGPCLHNQSLCERIAEERLGDARSDCPLCNPDNYMTDPNQRHYKLPAIPLRVKIHGLDTDEPWYHGSVTWHRLNESKPVLVAIVDMNFDRAHDLGHAFCKYVQV